MQRITKELLENRNIIVVQITENFESILLKKEKRKKERKTNNKTKTNSKVKQMKTSNDQRFSVEIGEID